MPAHEHINDAQFSYRQHDTGGSKPWHVVEAHVGGESVGAMAWTSHEIVELTVEPEHQRKGIATGMWREGHRVAAENARIPAPKHSPDRTTVGDKWAKSVGGPLPRRNR